MTGTARSMFLYNPTHPKPLGMKFILQENMVQLFRYEVHFTRKYGTFNTTRFTNPGNFPGGISPYPLPLHSHSLIRPLPFVFILVPIHTSIPS